jgi:hypothetical protein
MGINSIGRRLAVHNEIIKVQAISRAQWRSEILWSSPEYRPGCCYNLLPYGFPCCFEICVGIPSTYKLTNAKVIKFYMNLVVMYII